MPPPHHALVGFGSNQERSQQITISEPGSYRVTVTANNGCKISDEILVDAITNTEEELLVNTFSIYPNPTSRFIHLETPSEHPSEVMVFNLLGQVMVESQFSKRSSINVSDWRPGLYLVQIGDRVKKIMVE